MSTCRTWACNSAAGAAYHNLSFLVFVNSQDGLDTCASKIDHAEKLLDDLIRAAQQPTPAQAR
jgi:hypothetical protein